MREEFKLLVALQDLDMMIREVEEKKTSDKLKDMGFQLNGLEELQKGRAKLAEKIPLALRNRYERIAEHYKIAIIPVTGDRCLGCFSKLPTSFFSSAYSSELLTCENCGRLLFIP